MCTTIRHRPDAIAFIGDIHGNLNVFEHTLASVVNRNDYGEDIVLDMH